MIYLILALAGGVFYREFSKFHGYTGRTTLAYVHTHLLVLGMFLFLLTILFANQKPELLHNKLFQRFFVLHNIALPFMVIMVLVRFCRHRTYSHNNFYGNVFACSEKKLL